MSERPSPLPGTIVWLAPFWNRSGYGCASRTFVAALHEAGARIRVIAVNEVELGINDVDLGLIKRLESTPVVPPVTYIVSHVPSRAWLEAVKPPEPNIRIIATTFEGSAQGNAPPAEWLAVFREMDQVWLMTERERQVFIESGVAAEKVQVVAWPNPWLDNPVLDPPNLAPSASRFRFVSIAMFQPRRRWDTLIEAFFEEFSGNDQVELYLKVSYPSWHPQPGKPRQDLLDLVERLRRKTGSDAALTIDDDLGRRLDIVRLMDSCSVYISTDICPTAPLSEAWARQRMVIMADGLGYFQTTSGKESPSEPYIGIAVDPEARCALTKDMLLYQPHHKEAFMPKLHVSDVRAAMRRAYEMPQSERLQKMANATSYLWRPAKAAEGAIRAIEAGWKYREERQRAPRSCPGGARIAWEGPFFSRGGCAAINRELALRLSIASNEVILLATDRGDECSREDLGQKMAGALNRKLSGPADIHVRHQRSPVLTPPAHGRWVLMQSGEYGEAPAQWAARIAVLVDEVWTPNEHVRQSFISSGVPAERVVVVPAGVDVSVFYPVGKSAARAGRKFRFLFVGRLSRDKGIDILLGAFRAAFRRGDEVVLIVKDSGGGPIDPEIAETIAEMKKDPGAPNLIVYRDWLSGEQMRGMYNSCDCLVYPYRIAGVGMAVLEAMACALPVIVTAGGATDDFSKPGGAYLLAAKPVACGLAGFRPPDVVDGEKRVLEPDRGALAGLMREVVQNSVAARQRAAGGCAYIRSRYGWEKVAEAVGARIRILSERPVLRKI